MINEIWEIGEILNLHQCWTPGDPLAQSCLLVALVPEPVLLRSPGQECVPLHVADLVTLLPRLGLGAGLLQLGTCHHILKMEMGIRMENVELPRCSALHCCSDIGGYFPKL